MIPIQIIGIGQGRKDLTQAHLDLIFGCDILVGGNRLLDMFNDAPADTISIKNHVEDLIRSLEKQAENKKIVVLASGDPLFYGIGSTFSRLLDKGKFAVHTNISSISAAFAAIKTPWHDAKIVSLHGKNEEAFSFSQLAQESKIAFLTDPSNTPSVIAQKLIRLRLTAFKACVLENLGDPEKENIRWFDAVDDMTRVQYSQPNVVILLRCGRCHRSRAHQSHIGMDDTLFRHSKGLITKSEIRAISLSKLQLVKKNLVLWDIGSGSGSVGIEASFLLPGGHIFAIEKNESRIADIITNVTNFNCTNVRIVHAEYPEGVSDLEAPDRIFIGGGGSNLDSIICHAVERLSNFGVIVINTVLLQNLETAVTTLKTLHIEPDVIQIQVSRGKPMPFGTRLEALNPVWIISGTKTKNSEETNDDK